MERFLHHLVLGLLVLLCMASKGFAQTTFNVVQHHPSTLSYNGAFSVFEQPDGYLVFSLGWSLDSTSSGIHVVKFDLEGNFVWLKEHRREYGVEFGYSDPVAEIPGGRYVASVLEYRAGVIASSNYLYWFNAEGDTIRTRFFRSDSASEGNIGSRQLVALPDGGFLNCGWCVGVPRIGCITRLDSTGTILWERLYTNTLDINKVTPLADGGFILGGIRQNRPDEAVVIRTDSLGAVQWTRYHGGYAVTGGLKALETTDGDILMGGAWLPTQTPLGQIQEQWASLFRYDAQGNSPTRKDYGYSYLRSTYHILPKDENHYWLVGGMYQYGDPDGVTLLFELDENLDSLWMRRYWYFEPDDANSFIYCVRSTSDGGLVMCGMTRQGVTDPLPYMQSNWLLKLDSYGCLVPGCHTVGVQEYALGLQGALHLAPNPVPAGVPLQLRFEPPAGYTPKGALRVVVLDALGREAHAEVLGAASMSTVLNMNLAAGLYYVHLTDGTSWLAGGKVIVE